VTLEIKNDVLIFFRCARCWRIRLAITSCRSRRTRCANTCTSRFAAARAAAAAMRSSAAAPVARVAVGRRSTPGRHPSQWWCKVHRPARSCITRSRSILISPRTRTPPRCCRITRLTRRRSRRARTLPPPAPCPRVCPASPPATPRYVWCNVRVDRVDGSVSQMRETRYPRYDIQPSENIQFLSHRKVSRNA